MNYELRQYSFGETIGKGFNLYFGNFIPIVLISLLSQVPVVILLLKLLDTVKNISQFDSSGFDQLLATVGPHGLQMLVMFILAVIVEGFLAAYIIHLTAKKFLGDNSPVLQNNDSTSILPYIFPVVLLSITISIITTLGLLALIVPGIIIGLGYSMATQVMVIEKRKIFESMKRSWELTKEKRWFICLIIFISWVIASSINQIGIIVVGLVYPDAQMLVIVSYAISAITSPFLSCTLVVVYFNLRIEKEGFNIEHLAQQFSMAQLPEPTIEVQQ